MKSGRSSWLVVSGLCLVLAGCQTGSHSALSSKLDNGQFMGLWSTYTHCQGSQDLNLTQADAQQLRHSVEHYQVVKHPVPVLLRPVTPFIAPPVTRLSVDPHAMAVACTLHAGHVALEAGRVDLATEHFHTALVQSRPGEDRFYIEQAQEGLRLANPVLEASRIPAHGQPIPVSYSVE